MREWHLGRILFVGGNMKGTGPYWEKEVTGSLFLREKVY